MEGSAPTPLRRLSDLACRLIVFVVYPISRARLVLRPYTNPGTDLDYYYDYVQRAAAGGMPYADFRIEYPPAAWLVMRAPATTDWVSYVRRFAWMATAFEVVAFGLLLIVTRRLAPGRFWVVAATYVLATTLLREFLPTRLDSGLLLILMIWAALVVSSQEWGSAGRALPYAVLGFGTSFKVVPVLMMPFALVHDVRRDGVRAWTFVLWFLAGAALPFVLLWPTSGSASFAFLTYHLDRGLEVESVWATLLWPMRWLGSGLTAAHVEHAIELVGPGASTFAQLSALGSVAAIGLCLAVERVRPWPGTALVAGTIGLAVFVTLSKVLSPQYFVWMLPLLLIAGTEVWTSDRAHRAWCAGILGIAALTILIYPRFFLAVIEMRPLGFVLLLARNILLLALVATLAVRVWTR